MPNQVDTGRSLGSKLKHRFMYALILLGGRRLAYVFLYAVAFFYSVSPSVSARSAEYIKRRFSPKNKWQFFKHTYLLNLTFGRTLIDRAALGILGHTQVSSTVAEQTLCWDLYQEGHGLLLLSAHAGCWQSAVYFFGHFLKGASVNILYYKNPKDNDKSVSEHQGRQAPFKQINPAGPLGGVAEMMIALQKGEVVCAMGDRVFGAQKNTVPVRFLGGTVYVPYSFYRLAGATGAPIVAEFLPWERRGAFGTLTARVIRVPDLGPQKEKYIPYAQQFVDELERFCIQYPYQFFNYYNLWESACYATND